MRKRTSPLFHVTPVRRLKSILKKGLFGDKEGQIFVITDRIVANSIARDQIFIRRFALLRILRKGIHGQIGEDNVAEFSASYHRIILQEHIAPQHLRYIGTFATDFGPTEYDYLKWMQQVLTYEQTVRMFESTAKMIKDFASVVYHNYATL